MTDPWRHSGAPPAADVAPDSGQLGQEFLFHLYRGSELLKDNEVDEAKGELERALALQPRDIEGQSLLGVVYFRLGHYPRAIRIYEELLAAQPEEIAPRVNLALCYLKTAQPEHARVLLEEVVQRKADHTRAWGYLGLCHQRLGDLDKARIAFARAGKPGLAARLGPGPATQGTTVPPAPPPVAEIAATDAGAALSEPPPPSVRAMSAGPDSVPPAGTYRASVAPATQVIIPPTATRLARTLELVFPEDPRVATHAEGVVLVRVDRVFRARSDCLYAVLPDGAPFETVKLKRRTRGASLDESLGGPMTPFVELRGRGRLVVGAADAGRAFAIELDGDPIFVREQSLAGFDADVSYENGRLSLGEGEHVPLVQLTGAGTVVIVAPERIATVAVSSRQPAFISKDRILGWVGRLLPRSAQPAEAPGTRSSLVALSGEGTVLMVLE